MFGWGICGLDKFVADLERDGLFGGWGIDGEAAVCEEGEGEEDEGKEVGIAC